MDMSLDDIINTRRGNKGSLRGRRNIKGLESGRERINGRANRSGLNRGGINRPNLNRSAERNMRDRKQVIDARLKIIQKNRQKVIDAREKLGEVRTDARLKLLKLKEANLKVTARTSAVRNTTMKNNILKASITNDVQRQGLRRQLPRERFGQGVRRDLGVKKDFGRIGQRQNLSPRGADLRRSINNDLVTKGRNQGFRSGRLGNIEQPVLKRFIHNDNIGVGNSVVWESEKEGGFRSGTLGRRPPEGVFEINRFGHTFDNGANIRKDFVMSEEIRGSDEVFMRTFNNQRSRAEMDNFPAKMTRPSQIKIVMHNDSPFIQKQHPMEFGEEYDHYFKQPARPLPVVKQGRPFMDFSSQGDDHLLQRGPGGRMSQEMLARLDTPAPAPRSMGILSTQGPQAISMNADIGHRIVVSNLQPSVTHEDIKELFEDIGPLLASRVVRPGTAEVIYSLQKDAKKAVEAYHNRQLDGQPMKCMLVNPRALPMNTGSIGGLRSPAVQIKIPSSSTSSVMPDLSAIHKALFSK